MGDTSVQGWSKCRLIRNIICETPNHRNKPSQITERIVSITLNDMTPEMSSVVLERVDRLPAYSSKFHFL